MRLGLSLFAAFFGWAAWASAQTGPSLVDEQNEVAKRIEQRAALLTEKLDLNESQQANAEECLKAAAEKAKEIRDDSTLSDEQKKSLWASSRKAYRNYLRSLLTDEQKDAFDALLAALADKAKAAADKDKPSDLPADPKDPILDDLGTAPAFAPSA